METTWRLKATRGHGWIEHVDRDGRCTVTGNPEGAYQWGTRDQAQAVMARLRPGLVPVRLVEGSAFAGRTHGAPS